MKEEKRKKQTDSVNRKCVLEMTNSEARKFFLKNESYCDLDLPTYFRFDQLLDEIANVTKGQRLSDFSWGRKMVRKYDGVNYVLFNNKDGKYAWRPMALIHPFIYVSLVNVITEEEAWNHICEVFREHREHLSIQCGSLPVETLSEKKRSNAKKDKAEKILHWWKEIEQKSIELSLTYQYLTKADIADCYPSIYTHTIAWALHSKEVAKANPECNEMVGNSIDHHIQDMNRGQTNGIPQGSVLMDFIAEIVLSYADDLLVKLLQKKLAPFSESDYRILRFRDDYRIFSQNQRIAEEIVKCLSETLMDLNLKLNPAKTKFTNKVIGNAQKPEKRYWITQRRYDKNMQKHLIIIHEFADRYPNSGGLKTALDKFYDRVDARYKRENVLSLIAIVSDIAYCNPGTYPPCCAIISKFLKSINDYDQKKEIISKIYKKFQTLPNTEYLEIWLQRISVKIGESTQYKARLCKMVSEENTEPIWNSEWIKGSMKNKIDTFNPVNREELARLSDIILKGEYSVFPDYD